MIFLMTAYYVRSFYFIFIFYHKFSELFLKFNIKKNIIVRHLPHTKKVITFRLDEEECNCKHCNGKLRELAPEHITSRLAIIPGKVYMVEYNRMKYMCPHCDKKANKAVIVSAPNNTPAPVTNKGLADASLIADIAQRKVVIKRLAVTD